MVSIQGISKRFGARQALHPLTLDIDRGEIFGLLGHNGAGKSTTFGISLGHVRPDAGEVFIQGVSVQKNRAKALHKVGAIFESPAFFDYLSGWRNLELLVSLTALPEPAKMREVVDLVGLTARIHDPVRVYSHGMRQRLALAQALLPGPEFIILDEPSEGLDPRGIQEMRHLILRLRDERNLTVLLSSHLLSEVEQICGRIAILNQGQLVFSGSWQDVTARNRRMLRLGVDSWEMATPILRAAECGVDPTISGTVELPDAMDIADLVGSLVAGGVRVHQVELVEPSLEDFYLERGGG